MANLKALPPSSGRLEILPDTPEILQYLRAIKRNGGKFVDTDNQQNHLCLGKSSLYRSVREKRKHYMNGNPTEERK